MIMVAQAQFDTPTIFAAIVAPIMGTIMFLRLILPSSFYCLGTLRAAVAAETTDSNGWRTTPHRPTCSAIAQAITIE
jgi:hypothetical protein